jgi:circadian clock protein KaiB
MTERSSKTQALRLRLFVAGSSPNSVAARRNLNALLAEHPSHVVTIDVVDVLEEPEAGVRAMVLVTPTLIRLGPLPERRIIGNLSNADALRAVLGLGDT